MSESSYFGGLGGSNFPETVRVRCDIPRFTLTFAAQSKKRVILAKFSGSFISFPNSFLSEKHPILSPSIVTGPDLQIFSCRQHWMELKQFFNFAFTRSCIFCNV